MAKISTDRFPYNELTIETDTMLGNCLRIPKIFVKNSVDENGLITRMISNVKLNGYHCHPAFMQDGHERNAILIKAALEFASDPVTFADAKSAETTFKTSFGVDYHMYNIYEHHLIALLMLIEYGTTDLQNAIGGSDTANTADWHGLPQHWGDVKLWIDGIDTKGTDGTVRIFDNLGNFTLQDTDYLANSTADGYPVKLATNSGDLYDFKDIFIGDHTSFVTTLNSGSIGDCQDLGNINANFIVSESYSSKENGAFYLAKKGPITAAYRMAKFTD